MPKQQLSLNKFEGGISDIYDPRDIGANSLADATNAIVSTIGKIRVMSKSRNMGEHNNYATSLCSSIRGNGAFTFNSDYRTGETVDITDFDDPNGFLTLTVLSHSVVIGDKIWVMGTGEATDGYHIVTLTDSTTIITDRTASGISGSIADHQATFVKMDSMNNTHIPNIALGNDAKVGIFQTPSFIKDIIEIYSNVTRGSGATGANLTGVAAKASFSIEHSFYWSNGGLRICDSNFNNTGTDINKVYEYLPAKTYFNFGLSQYLSVGTGFVEAGGYAEDGTELVVTDDANGFDAVNLSGNDTYHVIRSTSVIPGSFSVNNSYNVSFDLKLRADYWSPPYDFTGLSSYDPNGDPEAIGSFPMCYFTASSSSTSPNTGDVLTQIELAKPGHNNFTFKANSDTITNPDSSIFCFAVNQKSAYSIRNFTMREWGVGTQSPIDNVSGRKSGWYDSPQEITSPSLHLNAADHADESYVEGLFTTYQEYDNLDTDATCNIGPDCLVMALATNESIFNSDWLFGGNSPSQHTRLSFAHSWVYEGNQESLLFDYSKFNHRDTINALPLGDTDGNGDFILNPENRSYNMGNTTDGRGLDFKLKFQLGTPRHNRRIGSRLYLTGYGPVDIQAPFEYGQGVVSHAPLIDDPLLFADIDFEKGVTLFDGTEAKWTSSSDTHGNLWSQVEFTGISKFPSLTYKLLNTYSHKQSSLYARYKSSTIANNRVYLGGIKQDSDNTGDLQVYSDRILKSPVGKYDVFPSNNFMEVAINDGEDIVDLYSFNDRILQFKENTLYIINVAGEYEFVETQMKGMGVSHKAHIIETDFGIAFFNTSGCYLFDGQKVASLTAQKIDISTWKETFPGNAGMIGYSPVDKYIICAYHSKQWVYSFVTQSWVKSDILGFNTLELTNSINLLSTNGMIICDTSSESALATISASDTTSEVMGTRAKGSIRWTAANIASDSYVSIKDSGGNARQVSRPIIVDISDHSTISSSTVWAGHLWFLQDRWADKFNEYIETANTAADSGGYTRPGIKATIIGQEEGETENITGLDLEADSFGVAMNSNATGNAAIYGVSDTDLGLSNPVWEKLQGGVNPVKGVTTITITRANTDADYKFSIYIEPTTAEEGYIPVSRPTIQYITEAGDNANTVAAALTAGVNGSQYYAMFLVATVSSNVITITARAMDATSATTEVSSGYFLFQNSDFHVSVVQTPEIKLFEFKPSIQSGSLNSINNFQITTRDIDFGTPGVRKKVYKVYVTYRSTEAPNSYASFYVNGSTIINANRKSFDSGTNYTSDTFDDTDGEWKVAELVPSTSSDANNIYSISLRIGNKSGLVVPTDFEINDITFVYRTKNVK